MTWINILLYWHIIAISLLGLTLLYNWISFKFGKIKTVSLSDIVPSYGKSFFNNREDDSKYNWEELETQLSENYNVDKHNHLLINQNNMMVNGYHRQLLLKELHGLNYELEVKVVWRPKILYRLRYAFLLPVVILFPYVGLFLILKRIFNGKTV